MNNIFTLNRYVWNRRQVNHSLSLTESNVPFNSRTIKYAPAMNITRSGDNYNLAPVSEVTVSNVSNSEWDVWDITRKSTTITITNRDVEMPGFIVYKTMYSPNISDLRLDTSTSTPFLYLQDTGTEFRWDRTAEPSTIIANFNSSLKNKFIGGIADHVTPVYYVPNNSTITYTLDEENIPIYSFTVNTVEIEKRLARATALSPNALNSNGWQQSYLYYGIWTKLMVTSSFDFENLRGKYWTTTDTNVYYWFPTDTAVAEIPRLVSSGSEAYLSFEDPEEELKIARIVDIGNITLNIQLYPTDGMLGGTYYRLISSPDTPYMLDSDIIGGVNYNININSDTDILVGTAASAEIKFDTYNDELTVGTKLVYKVKQNGDNTYKTVGSFKVYEISFNRDKYSVTAYDAMTDYDIDIYEWLHAKTYPITVSTLFHDLCFEVQRVGNMGNIGDHCNPNFVISADFSTQGITARTVLAYLALIGGCFIKAEPTGVIKFCKYKAPTTAIEIDNADYVKVDSAGYIAPAIDKVRVSLYDDDIGYSAGTGTSVLKIVGNSAFYNTEASNMQTATNNILTAVQNKAYVPMTVKLLNDKNIQVGDIITVDDVTTTVMSKSWSNSEIIVKSTGNTDRSRDNTQGNSDIATLNGKFNRLSRTVDSTVSTVGQLGTSVTTIEQKLDNITLSVAPAVGEAGSKITMNMNSIEVASANITLSGLVVFQADLSGSGTTTINGDNITTGTLTGITISGDTINGSTINLGAGRGNSGALYVYDEDDDEVGRFDEDGLRVGQDFYVRYDDEAEEMVTYIGGFRAFTNDARTAHYLATLDGTSGMGDHPTWNFWAGSSGVNPPFAVDHNGNLICNNLTVNGTSTGINNVIANPTITGSEALLTALQVGGTKYRVASGSSIAVFG